VNDLETKPQAEGTSRLHALLVVGDEVSFRELPKHGELLVGRSRDAGLCIEHPTVSREHAVLRLVPLAVKDLGGTNGTTLRGQRLAANHWVDLKPGDAVHFGEVVLVVRREFESSIPLDGRRLFERLQPMLARIAAGSITVLILGETGAGKEICAENIHRLSPRAGGTFLRLNCAAMPEGLLEGELFGHERGAFTGAVAAKPGLLESAEGGTVFLDEIGELPLSMQVKLLRVLDSREVLRIGGLTPRIVDVRFLAATHRDLRSEIAANRFREDLYYRLSAVTVRVPPLRERADEIPALAIEFAAMAARDLGVPPPALSPEALVALTEHTWPGNVRELRNVVTHAVLLSKGLIQRRHLELEEARPVAVPTPSRTITAPQKAIDPTGIATDTLADEVRTLERARILETLERCGGNQTRAARELGISRGTLVARLTDYGITRPRKP
jgi:two-component system, NtrC family, response regulator AtoC